MSRQGQATPSTSDRLVGAFKKNPEGILLLAAGACLLLRKSSALVGQHPQTGQHPQQSGAPGKNRRGTLSKAVADAQGYASDVAAQAAETVESVSSAASDYASKATRGVGEQSGRVLHQAQTTLQGTADRILQEQPLAIALAGLAAGAAVAAAFPATDFEREHFGPIGDHMSEAAQRVGANFKDAASKAGEILKSAAQDRGLSPDGLKEVASEVAGAFTSTVTGSGPNAGKPTTSAHRAGSAGERKGG